MRRWRWAHMTSSLTLRVAGSNRPPHLTFSFAHRAYSRPTVLTQPLSCKSGTSPSSPPPVPTLRVGGVHIKGRNASPRRSVKVTVTPFADAKRDSEGR
jgi:hypothetical protein